jgi:hypothetical protein
MIINNRDATTSSCSHAYLVLFGISVFSKLKYSIAWLINISLFKKKKRADHFLQYSKKPLVLDILVSTLFPKKEGRPMSPILEKKKF